MGGSGGIIMIVVLIGVFVLMWRSSKKQEREQNEMRNSLEVGDEITTIGGIIGEIVKIKEETVTIETGKDRTKIRILRSAIRSVDVHAAEKDGRAAKKAEEAIATPISTPVKADEKPKKKAKKEKAQASEDIVIESSEVTEVSETAESAE